MSLQHGEPDPLIAAMQDPSLYPGTVSQVRVIETHISVVLLAGEYAYKLKKPVKLAFLDFSTLQARRHFCDEELRLNRRLAPALYLDVIPIGGSREHPQLDTEPAIEYAVRMRRFDDRARLDHRLEDAGANPDSLDTLAEQIARFHQGLSAAKTDGTEATRVRDAALENLDELDALARNERDRTLLSGLREWTIAECDLLSRRFDERGRYGAVRECHGDLHLENLVEIDGRIVPFDALEFDVRLRTIDVLDEAAFLTMDLLAHGHGDAAFRFLNRYLECSGDYEGLDLLRFYIVYRALVRAKVRTLAGGREIPLSAHDSRAAPYLHLAAALPADDAPVLVITHGLSGSGKTRVTDRLISQLPAIRIRSDVERKRLHASSHVERTGNDRTEATQVGTGIYDAAATERTYALLATGAESALRSGINVIVDAAFLDRHRRQRFAELAASCGARFAILVTRAPEAVLRERIVGRSQSQSDASDADLVVLEHQLAHHDALDDRERSCAVIVDTSETLDEESIAAALREHPRAASGE
jgi:uncharacterized protein